MYSGMHPIFCDKATANSSSIPILQDTNSGRGCTVPANLLEFAARSETLGVPNKPLVAPVVVAGSPGAGFAAPKPPPPNVVLEKASFAVPKAPPPNPIDVLGVAADFTPAPIASQEAPVVPGRGVPNNPPVVHGLAVPGSPPVVPEFPAPNSPSVLLEPVVPNSPPAIGAAAAGAADAGFAIPEAAVGFAPVSVEAAKALAVPELGNPNDRPVVPAVVVGAPKVGFVGPEGSSLQKSLKLRGAIGPKNNSARKRAIPRQLS